MQIQRPTLILDKEKCLLNIRRMAHKAIAHRVLFRPHFKTHQSAVIANWFREFGVDMCTVSSVRMAEYFARHGWEDISIAFPVNILEIDRISELTRRIRIALLVESVEAAEFLVPNINSPTDVYIKIDTGAHRTGVDAKNMKVIRAIRDVLDRKSLRFRGFLTHAGHTYTARSTEEILRIHEESMESLFRLKDDASERFRDCYLSIGDTPSCTLTNIFNGIDEIRPGNFVFYDVMQQSLGVCGYEDIAVSVACPVVATHTERNEIVIYGGAVHLSKDFIPNPDGSRNFGMIVQYDGSGWREPLDGCYVKALSQEHGIIHATDELLRSVKLGSVLGILPIHSCLTAHALGSYTTLEGERIELMDN